MSNSKVAPKDMNVRGLKQLASKQLVIEYIQAQANGSYNMFEFQNVRQLADDEGWTELADCSKAQYTAIIARYSDLLEIYDLGKFREDMRK